MYFIGIVASCESHIAVIPRFDAVDDTPVDVITQYRVVLVPIVPEDEEHAVAVAVAVVVVGSVSYPIILTYHFPVSSMDDVFSPVNWHGVAVLLAFIVVMADCTPSMAASVEVWDPTYDVMDVRLNMMAVMVMSMMDARDAAMMTSSNNANPLFLLIGG